MEREKRQIKVPQEYAIGDVCYPRVRRNKPNKKMPPRAQFQVIPAPIKYTCIANSFVLYGVNRIPLSFFLSFFPFHD